MTINFHFTNRVETLGLRKFWITTYFNKYWLCYNHMEKPCAHRRKLYVAGANKDKKVFQIPYNTMRKREL